MDQPDESPLPADDPEPLRRALVRVRDGIGEEVVEIVAVDPVMVEKKGLFGKTKLVEANLFLQCVWYGSPDGSGGFMVSVGYPPGPPLSQRGVPLPHSTRIANEDAESALVELADELSPAAAAEVILYLANTVIGAHSPRGMLVRFLDSPSGGWGD